MSMTLLNRPHLVHRQMLRSLVVAANQSAPAISTGTTAVVSASAPSSQRTFSSAASVRRLRRRKRPDYGIAKLEGTGPPKDAPPKMGLDAPYSYGGKDGTGTEEYLQKTSLSPWVPIPDPIARKLFDMSAAGPEDIHVELGCGDGRVNFYAIDHGKVQKSTGVDIDEGILEQATERLGKRYPPPPIEFIQADLLDPDHPVWDKIQEATILTMYFVEDALQMIRPILEEKLAGKHCKIITCAYEMKGWTYSTMETTLGTTVYMYHWGNMEDEDLPFFDDDLLVDKPKGLMEDPLDKLRAGGLDMTKIEHVETFIPERYNPDYDSWSDSDSDDDDDDHDDESKEKAKKKNAKTKKKKDKESEPTSERAKKKPPCSKD